MENENLYLNYMEKSSIISLITRFNEINDKTNNTEYSLTNTELLEWYFLITRINEMNTLNVTERLNINDLEQETIFDCFKHVEELKVRARFSLRHRGITKEEQNSFIANRDKELANVTLADIASKIDVGKLPKKEVIELDEKGVIKIDPSNPSYKFFTEDD
ncbi:hypothetical protein M662_03345 [Bacillus sp. SB49]|uniref:hypothetical protein n=1 Tax=Bacillus sp. SB49 TaxID=1071080 RepID=UPI00047E5EFF|nr:hypothetical protein [Bacillus sp. SB49]QHT45584.1 hypothetical protein M662_03345 [Bacillus sp. SB49]